MTRWSKQHLLVVDNDATGEGNPKDNDDSRVKLLLVLLRGATREDATVGGLCAHTAVTGSAHGRSTVACDRVVAGLLVD